MKGAYLTVRVTNSSDNPEKKKSERKGYGIEILKDIVKKYQGYYYCECDNGEYMVVISMNDDCIEEKKAN